MKLCAKRCTNWRAKSKQKQKAADRARLPWCIPNKPSLIKACQHLVKFAREHVQPREGCKLVRHHGFYLFPVGFISVNKRQRAKQRAEEIQVSFRYPLRTKDNVISFKKTFITTMAFNIARMDPTCNRRLQIFKSR